jgi:hypothetical protein
MMFHYPARPFLQLLTLVVILGAGQAARAQTDEIQVYTAEVANPGQVTLTFHNNYIAKGRAQASFPGGIVPDRSFNGVTEIALGLTDWWELGAYAPFVYSIDRDGRFFIDGVKLRNLFVSPHANSRRLFYGMNFELSYNRPQWAITTWQLEFRPIIGVHLAGWELAFNPIFDVPLARQSGFDFAPATRVVFHFSDQLAAGLELYEDFGFVGRFVGIRDQQQALFAVADVSFKPVAFEVGVGHGFTESGSDPLIFKAIITPNF